MKTLNYSKTGSLLVPALLLFAACSNEGFDEETLLTPTNLTMDVSCDALIDFNGLDRGLIVESVSSGNGISGVEIPGSVMVYGENLSVGASDENHAMIFDTDNPTGGDEDLVVAGEDHQEVLIISEDLDGVEPDDQAPPGGIITLDFSAFGSGTVDVNSFVTIDNEEAGEWAAYDAGDVLIASGEILSIEDGTQQVVEVNTAGIAKLVVTFNGSGALDEFCLSVEEEEESGCTLTQGYWKNTKKGPWPAPYDRDDTFYLSGMTWQEVLKTAPKGNAYFQAAHQYIAATLNVANEASSPEEVDDALAAALELFEMYNPAEIDDLSGDDELRKEFIYINDVLDSYNTGEIGPGHCD
ncbi:hypothetical protein [Flagellimonas sp. GZD32]|uniref:hypothetical protein n=1 Tax=Flagellimonas cixiensis TaxID=3228750 RepID=UPI0035C8B954